MPAFVTLGGAIEAELSGLLTMTCTAHLPDEAVRLRQAKGIS
jgi:hypothetical protein